MRIPGFTAENSLGRGVGAYRGGRGGAAAGQGVRPAAINPGGKICRDCDGNIFTCPWGTFCNRLCTANGGFAYCERINVY